MQFDHIVDQVAQRVADIVAAKLAGIGTGTNNVYTSHRLPPDIRTKARFHQLAKSVPGSRRQGRTWIVDADAWAQFRQLTAKPLGTGGLNKPTTNYDVDALAAQILMNNRQRR